MNNPLPITITIEQECFVLKAVLHEGSKREEVLEVCDNLLDVLYGKKDD